MLNPNWKKYNYQQDLETWNKIKHTSSEFLSLRYTDIFNLLSKYAVTESGGSINVDRFSEAQRYRILEKTMTELEKEMWTFDEHTDESLDARLEREKGEYESRQASMKLSSRDNNDLYSAFDDLYGDKNTFKEWMKWHDNDMTLEHLQYYIPEDEREILNNLDNEGKHNEVENHPVFKRAALDEYEELYNQFIDNLNLDMADDGGIYVYRCITVSKFVLKQFIEKLKLGKTFLKYKGIGIYWAWDENSAECHWGNFKDGYVKLVLKGKINLGSIDIKRTFMMNVSSSYSEESEISLHPNAQVEIVGIEGIKEAIQPVKINASFSCRDK